MSISGDSDRALNSGSEYLQCAGSAEAMTLEHRSTVHGVARHVVVGTPERSTTGELVEVCWQRRSVLVQPHEVFDSVSAAAVFEFYFKNGELPNSVTQRELDQ